ncbi:MAG: TonB-dependent receptor [Flavobacteriales bacterium]|nr:TonB-dependent receptor [Flavobacteriales bacterium]
MMKRMDKGVRSVMLVAGMMMCGGVRAQEKDSTWTIDLKAVRILGSQPRNQLDRMKEVEGVTIMAGKKNEVIRMAGIDADLSTNNARQVFARVPGISVWENDGSGVQVGIAARGLSPNRSWEFNVRQNGYDICAEVFGYPEAYYSPPMEAVERIELVRGAASLQFGPQFGGLLNYQLKKGVADRKIAFETRQTAGSYGLYNTYNAIGGTVGKWSYYAFHHHRSADGWRANSRYTTNTGHASITYSPSKRLSISAEYTRMDLQSQQPGGLTDSLFHTDARSSARERNWFGAPWNVAALTIDHRISELTRVNVKVFSTFAERNSVGFVKPINVPDTINRLTGAYAARQVDRDNYTNYGAEVRVLHGFTLAGKQDHLAVGARVYRGSTERHQQGKGSTGSGLDLFLTDPTYGKELSYGTDNVAVFAESLIRMGERLSVVPGVRYEYIKATRDGRINTSSTGVLPNEQQDRRVFLYGAGLEYCTSRTANAYANYSRAFRPVLFSELTPSATTDVIDPNLKDATGFNLDGGYRGAISQYLSFDVGGFLLHYNDRIGTIQQDGVAHRTNVGAMVSQGVEAYVQFEPWRMVAKDPRYGKLSVFASVAYIDARYSQWNDPATVNDPVRTIAGNRVENAPRTIERYGANYLYKGFSASAQWSRVGDVYTDALNTEDPNAASTIGMLPAYQVVDVFAGYRFNNGLDLHAGVNNLADTSYATRRSGGYPGPGLLPANGRTAFLTIGARF